LWVRQYTSNKLGAIFNFFFDNTYKGILPSLESPRIMSILASSSSRPFNLHSSLLIKSQDSHSKPTHTNPVKPSPETAKPSPETAKRRLNFQECDNPPSKRLAPAEIQLPFKTYTLEDHFRGTALRRSQRINPGVTFLLNPTEKGKENRIVDTPKALGKGGFGTVIVAEGITHDGKRTFFAKKKQGVLYTEKEVAQLKNFQHPNVIRYINHTDTSIIMPLAKGSVDQFLPNITRLSVQEKYNFVGTSVAHVASGLAYLHSKNYIHSDIKLKNILLFEDKAVIGDFGSAHTRLYEAPEHTKTTQSDMWSLGCALFELLYPDTPLKSVLWRYECKDTKTRYFRSEIEIHQIIKDLLLDELLKPFRDSLLLQLLSINPSKRYTAAQVEIALSSFNLNLEEQTILFKKLFTFSEENLL
jgi:hypothetical protein